MAMEFTDAISSPYHGDVIQSKLFSSADHWSFLDEIEAPMWADLTLETELMNQDIDDAWFRSLHLIHQTSSRQLKSFLHRGARNKVHSPKLSCFSQKVPESVSQSRGKHYKSRKWTDNNYDSLANTEHPIRDLVSNSSVGTAQKNGTCGSSTSTVTFSSSCKATQTSLADKNKGGMRKSQSITGTCSSSSAMSKFQKPEPKSKLGYTTKTYDAKKATTVIDCKTSGLSRTSIVTNKMITAQSKVAKEEVLQSRNSYAGKSSVGSSSSLGSVLDRVTPSMTRNNDSDKECESKTSLVVGTSFKAQVAVSKVSTSEVAYKSSRMSSTLTLKNSDNTRCSLAHKQGKLSRESSHGLRNKIGVVSGNNTQNSESNKGNRKSKVLNTVQVINETRTKDRTSDLKHKTLFGERKLASKESKVKSLFCSAARKPLSLLSQPRQGKDKATRKPAGNIHAAKKELASSSGKENIQVQNVKPARCKNSNNDFNFHKEKFSEASQRSVLIAARKS